MHLCHIDRFTSTLCIVAPTCYHIRVLVAFTRPSGIIGACQFGCDPLYAGWEGGYRPRGLALDDKPYASPNPQYEIMSLAAILHFP